MSGCAPPFLRSSLNNKAKIKLKNTEHSNMSTDSLPSDYFDQQLQNILVILNFVWLGAHSVIERECIIMIEKENVLKCFKVKFPLKQTRSMHLIMETCRKMHFLMKEI